MLDAADARQIAFKAAEMRCVHQHKGLEQHLLVALCRSCDVPSELEAAGHDDKFRQVWETHRGD